MPFRSGQTLVTGRIPLPGGGVAAYGGSGLQAYGHADRMGNIRLFSTPARGLFMNAAYTPYGAEYDQSGGATWRVFTGKDQGIDWRFSGGQYDFPEREYNSIQSRWWTPDPSGLAAVNPNDPQSWNAYAYVGNTPLLATDPLGLRPKCASRFFTGPNCEPDLTRLDGLEPDCTLDGGSVPCSFANGALQGGMGFTVDAYNVAAAYWNATQAWVATTPEQWWLYQLEGEAAGKAWLMLQALARVDPNIDPNLPYQVATSERGGAFDITLANIPLDVLAAAANGWADPLSSLFHNGNPSWYEGSPLQMFDVVHLVYNPGGAEGHVDPYGPLNPLHLGLQVVGGWLDGTTKLPAMTCSVAAGCSY